MGRAGERGVEVAGRKSVGLAAGSNVGPADLDPEPASAPGLAAVAARQPPNIIPMAAAKWTALPGRRPRIVVVVDQRSPEVDFGLIE